MPVGKGRQVVSLSQRCSRMQQGGSLQIPSYSRRACSQAGRNSADLIVAGDKMKVLVVGAGGRTGKLVLEKLLAQPQRFEAKGMVRSEKSAEKVRSSLPSSADALCLGDITSPSLPAAVKDCCEGYDALVLLTSAVPKIKILSLIVSIVTKILPGVDAKRPEFSYPEAGTPEKVDWLGAKNQIDAAQAAGIKRVVFVSSMGGTQIDNFLNTMGGGNILLYKRKAEMYLQASGLEYTIIHPGGLTDAKEGEREIIVGVDDTLLKREQRNIPRADVAELVVQCLSLEPAKNRSFDVCTTEGPPTKDFVALLNSLNGANCDYSLPKGSPVPLP
eukprot:CAMPEP_0196591838 /NCGR_PEP_ID=MMETSP1081-20130531/71034_1 /TAXON_ID=36882 /ORGANISM="Pyramimonas amylifera, Strain CCMP720" /LENGTH=329 /DNA_ID=CAMNT_0041915343 /DNA_START=151 /DNA_END=1140 /DNA_ORIENTATION=-